MKTIDFLALSLCTTISISAIVYCIDVLPQLSTFVLLPPSLVYCCFGSWIFNVAFQGDLKFINSNSLQ